MKFDAYTRRQAQAVFDAGAEVYDACVACHAKYLQPQAGSNAPK